MRYRVVVTADAEAAILREATFIAEDSGIPGRAVDWLVRAYALVETLYESPRGCALAAEDEHCNYEVRKLIHGRHLILFTVDDESETVYVMGCRHGMRLPRPDDLPSDKPVDEG